MMTVKVELVLWRPMNHLRAKCVVQVVITFTCVYQGQRTGMDHSAQGFQPEQHAGISTTTCAEAVNALTAFVEMIACPMALVAKTTMTAQVVLVERRAMIGMLGKFVVGMVRALSCVCHIRPTRTHGSANTFQLEKHATVAPTKCAKAVYALT